MKNIEFKKLLKTVPADEIKSNYMKGKCSLSDRQLAIVCEKGSHHGATCFNYFKTKTCKK